MFCHVILSSIRTNFSLLYFHHRRFGQLGCSGFVVSDRQGRFVSRKTKAFLQHGEAAFSHVEDLLRETFDILPSLDDDNAEEETTARDDVLHPDWVLPSVGVTSMDCEHQECEDALSLLRRVPTVASLAKVMEVLTAHFQHEEELMKKNDFGRPHEKFSPYSNHVQDHERILDIGYSELAKRQEPNGSFLAMQCSETRLGEPAESFLAITCSDVGGQGASGA
ncbi:hypothetical protein ACHAXR_006090 [Thalassiosira sp. AJA248-18]